MRNNQTDFLHIGEEKNYIEFLNERTTIRYIAADKKYRFTDPEEQVRAKFYVELIEHFQYSENRIDLEVRVPRRTLYCTRFFRPLPKGRLCYNDNLN